MNKTTTDTFIQDVIRDCVEYSRRFNCSMETALYDWEGDGPNGSWGLNRHERDYFLSLAEFNGITGNQPT